jgi:hypothetical protein
MTPKKLASLKMHIAIHDRPGLCANHQILMDGGEQRLHMTFVIE